MRDETDCALVQEGLLAFVDPFERMIVHGHAPIKAAGTGAFAAGRPICS
jgi:hypothetical protein